MRKKLMAIAQRETQRFLNRVLVAPTSYKKVLGQKLATKYDVERDYINNLKHICTVATQLGAQEVIDYCQASVVDDLSDLKKDILDM